MPDSHHIVLADDPPIEEIVGSLGPALGEIQEELAIEFDEPVDEAADGTTLLKFTTTDGSDTLTVVDDPETGRHIAIRGDHADTIASKIADALPAEPEEALVARAQESRSPRTVMRVALAQGLEPSDGAEGVIVGALRSSDPDIVAAGITAAAMTDPSRFEGDLRRLAAEALGPALRLMAEQALAGGGRG